MYKLLIFILIISFFSCKKEKSEPLDCKDDMEMDTLYLAAAKLYALKVQDNRYSNERNSIQLPDEKVNPVYNAFKAIKGLNTPEADSVFNLYKIPYSYYYPGEFQDFTLLVSDTAFVNKLLSGSISKFSEGISQNRLYFIKSEPPASPTGFISEPDKWKLFYKSCGIVNPFALNTLTDHQNYYFSNIIKFNKDRGMHLEKDTATNSYYLEFSAGEGNARTWAFRVDANNQATFVNSFGGPAPPL